MTKRKAPKQTEQFIAFTSRARRLLQGKPRAAQIYTDLLARSGPRASVQVRQSVIADALGVHVNTVGTAVRALTDLGLVEVRRTVRSAYYWLPEHPGYAADLDAYETRKARNAAKKAGVPHIEPQDPHIEPQHYGHRPTTDCGSGTTTDCGSISIDVSLSKDKEITNRCSPPSGARASGPSAPSGSESNPAGPPAWAVADVDEGQGQEPKKAPAAPLVMKKTEDETRAHLLRKSRNVIAGNQAQKPSEDLLASKPGWWKFYEMHWYDLPGEDPKKMTREALERARRKPVRFAAERSGGWVS